VPKTAADHVVATKARDVATKHVVPNAMRSKRWPAMPGNRASGWKKKLNGETVRR
jgi:hypothetical protein